MKNKMIILLSFYSCTSAYAMRDTAKEQENYIRYRTNKELEERFLDAAMSHDPKAFNQCIQQDVDINCTDSQGRTALHLICYGSLFFSEQSVKNIDTLLQSPSLTINLQDSVQGRTALHDFMQRFSYDSVSMSYHHQINEDRPALLLEQLLQRGANPNIEDYLGIYPIQVCHIPNPALIKILLDNKSPLTYQITVELIKKSYEASSAIPFIYCFGLARRWNVPQDTSGFKTERLAGALVHQNERKFAGDMGASRRMTPLIKKKLTNYLQALAPLKNKSADARQIGEALAYQEHIVKS